jgi:hypothetical protein
MPSEELLAEYVRLGGDRRIIGALAALADRASKKKNRRRRLAQRKGQPMDNEPDILEEFRATVANISARIGGLSHVSFALATTLQGRLLRRQTELTSDEDNLADVLMARSTLDSLRTASDEELHVTYPYVRDVEGDVYEDDAYEDNR